MPEWGEFAPTYRCRPRSIDIIISHPAFAHPSLRSPKMSADLTDRAFASIARSLGRKVEELRLETRLVEDLRADSVDKFSLLAGLEADFDTEIPDEDLTRFLTVGDIVRCVHEHCSDG